MTFLTSLEIRKKAGVSKAEQGQTNSHGFSLSVHFSIHSFMPVVLCL